MNRSEIARLLQDAGGDDEQAAIIARAELNRYGSRRVAIVAAAFLGASLVGAILPRVIS